MSVSDLTNTTWLLNTNIPVSSFRVFLNTYNESYESFNINFKSNNNNYTSFVLYYSDSAEAYYIMYDIPNIIYTVYDDDSYSYWTNGYETIQITGGDDVTNSDLIAWLEANATLQDSGGGDTSSSTGKIGDLSIIKKHFGDLEVIKEVLNGVTIYSNGGTPTQSFFITTNVTNGSYTGDSTITNTASITISANTGYSLPSTISVIGATYTYNQTTGVISLSSPTSNVIISATCSKTYPIKKDVILMDLDGNGNKKYKVLKNVSGTTYEVLGLFYVYSSMQYGISNSYSYSNVNTTLNETWYNTLTATTKSAIVDRNIYQDRLSISSSSTASGYKAVSTGTSYTSNNYVISTYQMTNVGNRHIYALGMLDLIEYFGATTSMSFSNTTITYSNIWELFDTDYTGGNSMPSVFLRAGGGTGETQGLVGSIRVGIGRIENSRNDMIYGCAYPVFQIDLSKITFTINS